MSYRDEDVIGNVHKRTFHDGAWRQINQRVTRSRADALLHARHSRHPDDNHFSSTRLRDTPKARADQPQRYGWLKTRRGRRISMVQ